MRRALAVLVLLSLALPAAAGKRRAASQPENPPPTTYDWSALDAKLRTFVPSQVGGLVLIVARENGELYSVALGDKRMDSVVQLASASKIPSAMLLLALVNQGWFHLDQQLDGYFAGSFVTLPRDKQAITMRMLLNHTSGLVPDHPCLAQRNLGTAACVAQILAEPLQFEPGAKFQYGGSSYQVAGFLAERVLQTNFRDAFDAEIGSRLFLESFNYGNLGTNPRVGGGAQSHARDYMRLLQTLLARGIWDVERIIHPSLVAEMERDQIASLPKLDSPGGAAFPGYSFGWWHTDPRLLPPGSRGPELVDFGALGSVGWIDRDLGYAAVLLLEKDAATGLSVFEQIRPLIADQLR